jgi:hypothetical protein
MMMKITIVDKQPPPHFHAAAPAKHPRRGPSIVIPPNTEYEINRYRTSSQKLRRCIFTEQPARLMYG